MLRDEIDGLRQRLADRGRPVVQWLRPGLDVAVAGSGLFGNLPPELREWFEAWNGVVEASEQTIGDVSVVPGYWPVSWDEGLALRADLAPDPALGDLWFPLLSNGASDAYALVWDVHGATTVAGVLVGEPTQIEFLSVEGMVRFFNRCYDEAAFVVNDSGHLEMDVPVYERLYADT